MEKGVDTYAAGVFLCAYAALHPAVHKEDGLVFLFASLCGWFPCAWLAAGVSVFS